MQATASIELFSTFLAAQCKAFGDYKTARRESGFFGISRNATRREFGKIEQVIALARRPHRESWKKRSKTARSVQGVLAIGLHMPEFPLSPREKAILRRLAKGWTTADIRLSIGGTLGQVEEQQSRLLRKLRINTQKELVDAATRLARHRSEKGTPYNKGYKRR